MSTGCGDLWEAVYQALKLTSTPILLTKHRPNFAAAAAHSQPSSSGSWPSSFAFCSERSSASFRA